MIAEEQGAGAPEMLTPSRQPQFPPFARRLVLAFVLVDLCFVLLAGFWLHGGYLLRHRQAETSARNLAQVLENSLAGTIKQHDVALQAVMDEYARQERAGGIDRDLLNAYINRVSSRLPQLNGLRIADARGIFSYGVDVLPGSKADISDRDYFIQLRDDTHAGLFISKPVVSRVNHKWAVSFARRLVQRDGRFAGIANTSIALDEFINVFSALDVGKHGVISLRDGNMAVIARFPEPEGVGSTVGNAEISRPLRELMAAGQSSGIYRSSSGLDGVERVFAYRRISGYPLYVIVGLAKEDFLADWREEMLRTVFLVALLIGMTVLASWQINKAWRRQMDAWRNLQESEARLAASNERLAEARDEAMEANRIKSLFLAGVSHDLKHPLNALGLYLGYVKAKPASAPQALPGMEQALSGMGALLSRLLELSRLESGEIKPQLRTVRLDDIFRQSAARFSVTATGKGLRLRFVATAALLDTDPSMLQSIVDNLVGNAVRYTDSGGVVVGLRLRNGIRALEVVDTGPGIPEHRIPMLFDAYRRFDDRQRGKDQGYGLGLALVKKQCDLLEYGIEVSSARGQGSRFTVTLSRTH